MLEKVIEGNPATDVESDHVIHRFGEFELNADLYELKRAGKPIPVEPQVFEVLRFLVTNPDRLVSRDELVQSIWGDPYVSDATVSSRIMAARKALGDSGREQRWIKTVHGRGVRFCPEIPLASAHDGIKGLSDQALAERTRERAHELVKRNGWGCSEAEQLFREAVFIAEGAGAVEVFRAARYDLATLYELRGEFELSETFMRAAIHDPEGDDRDAESRELLACSLFHQGRFEEALSEASAGLEACSAGREWRLSAYYGEHPGVSCHQWMALNLWFLGRDDEAIRHSSQSLRLAEQQEQMHSLAHARQQAAMLHQLRRDFRICEHWASATISIGKRQAQPYREAAGSILQGWAQGMMNPKAASLSVFEHALDTLKALGAEMELAYFQTLFAEAALQQGDPIQAARLLDSALASPKLARGYFYLPEILRLRACVFAKSEDAKGAVSYLCRAREAARQQGARAIEKRCEETVLVP